MEFTRDTNPYLDRALQQLEEGCEECRLTALELEVNHFDLNTLHLHKTRLAGKCYANRFKQLQLLDYYGQPLS